MKKHLLTYCILGLTLIASGAALTQSFMKPQVIRHHGGKPRIPVQVDTSSSQVIGADTASTVDLVITPESPCRELRAKFRGIDGIEVLQFGEATSFGSCNPGQGISHSLVIRAPSGASGQVVVDLDMDGVPASLTVPFKAFGARSKPAPVGKMSFSESGEQVIELNPQAR